MGNVPVSACVLRNLACAMALGVALVAAGCAGSSGGGLADGHMESALPNALQKLTYKPGDLRVEVTTVRKSDGKTRTDDLKSLVINNNAGTFSGQLPFSLTADDYSISLAFIFNDPNFGEVTVATIDNVDVTIVEGGPNNIDVSAEPMTFPNDDGDVFSNLEEAESGTDAQTAGPIVALLANTSFVDYIPGNTFSEASNSEDSINSLGGKVVPFTDVTAAGIAAALLGADAVFLPEINSAGLLAAMDAVARAALVEFVRTGGTLIATQPSAAVSFLNTVFGLTLASAGGPATTLDAPQAAATPFAGGLANLPFNNGTSGVTRASLPPSSKAIYHDAAGSTTVALIPFGTGRIVLLGWDWFDSVPTDPAPPAGTGQDNGWLDVLKAALRATAPSRVALLADTAFTDYAPGLSGSEASNVEVALADSLGIQSTPFVGADLVTVTAALAGKRVLFIPDLERGDLSAGMAADAKAAIADFVTAGGTLVISREFNGKDISFLNTTFGFGLAVGTTALPTTDEAALDTAGAAGTAFAGGPLTLQEFSATGSFALASIPAGSQVIYTDVKVNPGDPVALVIPFGSGQIVVLGWDFFGAAPVGTNDGGWIDVLGRAVRSGL